MVRLQQAEPSDVTQQQQERATVMVSTPTPSGWRLLLIFTRCPGNAVLPQDDTSVAEDQERETWLLWLDASIFCDYRDSDKRAQPPEAGYLACQLDSLVHTRAHTDMSDPGRGTEPKESQGH